MSASPVAPVDIEVEFDQAKVEVLANLRQQIARDLQALQLREAACKGLRLRLESLESKERALVERDREDLVRLATESPEFNIPENLDLVTTQEHIERLRYCITLETTRLVPFCKSEAMDLIGVALRAFADLVLTYANARTIKLRELMGPAVELEGELELTTSGSNTRRIILFGGDVLQVAMGITQQLEDWRTLAAVKSPPMLFWDPHLLEVWEQKFVAQFVGKGRS